MDKSFIDIGGVPARINGGIPDMVGPIVSGGCPDRTATHGGFQDQIPYRSGKGGGVFGPYGGGGTGF